jgi:hypothetical protein
MTDDQHDAAAAAAVEYRTIPSAIFVKEYAVGHFNYLCGLLAEGIIDEESHGEMILEQVKYRRGLTSSWESLVVEPTGRVDGYLTEVRLLGGDEGSDGGATWWIIPEQIMRVEQSGHTHHPPPHS